MNIRRFNQTGLDRFAAWLEALRAQPTLSVPREMLEDPALTERLEVDIGVEDREFPRRFEAAEYLYGLLRERGLREPERDAGMWAWLSLFYFEQVCPANVSGKRLVRSIDSYIPLVDVKRRYYRHLLLGPYLIARAHAQDSVVREFLLTPKLDVATDEVYRLLVEGPLIQSAAAVGVAVTLYWDGSLRSRKRGVGVKAPGGMRRLVSVVQQFDRTYDIHSSRAHDLLSMLPREFDRFRHEVNHGARPRLGRARDRARA